MLSASFDDSSDTEDDAWKQAVRPNLPLRNHAGEEVDKAAWDDEYQKTSANMWSNPISKCASGTLPEYRLGMAYVDELRKAVPSEEWIREMCHDHGC